MSHHPVPRRGSVGESRSAAAGANTVMHIPLGSNFTNSDTQCRPRNQFPKPGFSQRRGKNNWAFKSDSGNTNNSSTTEIRHRNGGIETSRWCPRSRGKVQDETNLESRKGLCGLQSSEGGGVFIGYKEHRMWKSRL